MKKLALVFLGDYKYDARCINMINTLTECGHSVSIYSTTKNSFLHNNKLINEVTINPPSLPVVKYLTWTVRVYRQIRKQSYDVVIAADLYSLLPLVWSFNKAQIVYDSRELYTKLSVHVNSPIKNKLISLAEALCIKSINKVMVTAKSDLEYLKSIYSQYKISYQVVYNYPEKSLIYTKSSFLKNKLNLSNDKTILLYQGVLQKNRGIFQLIKIIQNTKNTIGVIIGNGEYFKFLKNYIYNNKLESRVYMMPAVSYDRLLQITASADIGVALVRPVGLSNIYALPNKLFEYALSGIPVLSSDLPNIKKYVSKYSLGWAVGVDDLAKQVQIIKNYKPGQKQKDIKALSSDGLFSWASQKKSFYNFIINE